MAFFSYGCMIMPQERASGDLLPDALAERTI
jgi:hypothetical protein